MDVIGDSISRCNDRHQSVCSAAATRTIIVIIVNVGGPQISSTLQQLIIITTEKVFQRRNIGNQGILNVKFLALPSHAIAAAVAP